MTATASVAPEAVNIADFARWLCDREGFSIDDETDEEREAWQWKADAVITEVLRRAVYRATDCAQARFEWEKPIREIHTRDEVAGRKACAECFRDWPCPTIRSLTARRTETP